MKKLILMVSISLLATGVCHAAVDPMVSVFRFQKAMANDGNTEAMMKLGQMYEQGLGTRQNLKKALQMYRKAKANGYTGAGAAILRVMRESQEQSDAARKAQQQAAKVRKYQQELQRAQAQQKALKIRQAELERQAMEKARLAALAKQRAILRARREAQERARAQAAQARAAAEARLLAQEQARLKQEQAQAQSQSQQKTATQETPAHKTRDSFKSNPCQGPAARVMSTCN